MERSPATYRLRRDYFTPSYIRSLRKLRQGTLLVKANLGYPAKTLTQKKPQATTKPITINEQIESKM